MGDPELNYYILFANYTQGLALHELPCRIDPNRGIFC